MASSHDKSIEFKLFTRILWRRKGLILLSLVSVVCATMVGLHLVPEQYRSSVDLTIEQRETLSRELENVLGGIRSNPNSYGLEEKRLAKIVGNVTSAQFLERVVKVLRMHEDPRLLDLARSEQSKHPTLTAEEIAVRMMVKSIQSRVQVGARGPGLYRFAVSDYNPETARALAHWISELFIDMTTKRELDRIQAARSFSQEQLRIVQAEVDRAEKALQTYRESLVGRALENNPVNGANLGRAEDVHSQLLEEQSIARDRLGSHARRAIDVGLPAEDATIREDPDIQGLARDVTGTLYRLNRARISTDNRDPAVLTMTQELITVRNTLYQALEGKALSLYEVSNPADWSKMADLVFAQLDAESHGDAATRIEVLVRDFKRRVRAEPGHELELKHLADEVARKRSLLSSFDNQRVASELQQRVETTDLGLRVEIVDRARLPLAPYWPNKPRVIALALLLGPLLGMGLAFLAELMDPTLRSVVDIQRIAPEPILGTIPLVDNVIQTKSGLRRRWVPVTLLGVVVVTAAFFVAKDRVFPDLGVPKDAIEAQEPVGGNE